MLGSKGPALGRFLARASLRGWRAGPDSHKFEANWDLARNFEVGGVVPAGVCVPLGGRPKGQQRLFPRSPFPPGEAWPGREPQSCWEAFPLGSTEASPALGSAWSSQRLCWAVVGSIVHPEEGTCALVLEALAPPPPAGCFGLTGWGLGAPAPRLLQVEDGMTCRAGLGDLGSSGRGAGTLGSGGSFMQGWGAQRLGQPWVIGHLEALARWAIGRWGSQAGSVQ